VGTSGVVFAHKPEVPILVKITGSSHEKLIFSYHSTVARMFVFVYNMRWNVMLAALVAAGTSVIRIRFTIDIRFKGDN